MSVTKAYETRVPGKWVLAGEHAVLRGEAALALPHPEWSLSLRFSPDGSASGLSVEPEQARGFVEQIIRGLVAGGRLARAPEGAIRIDSTIPVGAGLGSSAALCVALVRWLSDALRIEPSAVRAEATELEHRFHGRSSGMDVAAVLAGQPILFRRGLEPEALELAGRLPRFTFHDTGLRASTQACVRQVEEFRERSSEASRAVDQAMGEATRLAVEGLTEYGRSLSAGSLGILARAMNQAQECFTAWGLDPPEAQKLRKSLIGQGALAAKLTGAGGGGMVVALWSQ